MRPGRQLAVLLVTGGLLGGMLVAVLRAGPAGPEHTEHYGLFASVGFEELSRVTSPDSVVDAVLVRSNAGATTGFGYRVYVVPRGRWPDYRTQGAQQFLADRVDSLSVHWREPKVLEIRYTKARIFDFTNFWHSREVDGFNYVVELKLVPLQAGPALIPSERIPPLDGFPRRPGTG